MFTTPLSLRLTKLLLLSMHDETTLKEVRELIKQVSAMENQTREMQEEAFRMGLGYGVQALFHTHSTFRELSDCLWDRYKNQLEKGERPCHPERI